MESTLSQPLPVTLDDVQGTADARSIAIDAVGIKGLAHPMWIHERSRQHQSTVAELSAFVELPHHQRGIHMSRLVEQLNEFDGYVSMETFRTLTREIVKRQGSNRGYVSLNFKYFIKKQAPVTKIESLMDYQVSFIGEICGKEDTFTLKVRVPVMSLCPCSKKISRYGAHNQRSHVILSATLNRPMWIEDLVELIESQASCELYAVLKREDEAYVTEHSYDNPKFVEDVIRDMAVLLDQDERISAYTLSVENFESIHNHSAYARVQRDFRKAPYFAPVTPMRPTS